MRRVDALAVTGVVMLVGGAATFLRGTAVLPLWVAWLIGPLFWYLGFAVLIAWLLYRLLAGAARERETAVEPVRVYRARAPMRSNFHEHDYDVSESRMRNYPAFGTAVLLIVLSALTVLKN